MKVTKTEGMPVAASSPFTFARLHRAYRACRRRKRATEQASVFESQLESELVALECELRSRRWKPSASVAFVVTEPKVREIFAAPFRDRVVHHVLYNELVSVWERRFIHDSYACRVGKGTHRASIERLPQFLSSVTGNGRRNAYCLQADIRSFFTSIDQQILYHLIARHVRHPDLLWLARTIIVHDAAVDHRRQGQLSLFDLVPQGKSLFHAPKGKGLPIGNITSQFFANVYLNELDQFVKHTLKARHYVRYVDDFVLLHEDRAVLNRWRQEIGAFLHEHLALTLHPRKQRIFPVSQGIDFLGYVVFLDHIVSRRRVVAALKSKLWQFNRRASAQTNADAAAQWSAAYGEELAHMLACINSYYGLFTHANTYRLRRHLYDHHFGALRAVLEPANGEYTHFRWKEGATPDRAAGGPGW